MDISDNKKIGMFMMGLGAAFTGLGVLLFFDRALLALGNVLFVGGFPFLIGVKHTLALFNPLARGARWKGILAFFGGFLVLLTTSWGLVGFALEIFGVLYMFGSFMHTAVGYLGGVPIIGQLVNNSVVRGLLNLVSGGKRKQSMV